MSSREAELKLEPEPETRYLYARTESIGKRMTPFRIKRMLDVLLALAGILAVSPLCLIVAALIKRSDPAGAVIFKQFRIGKDGKPFLMYKFRSMVTGADRMLDNILHLNETEGAMFKMKNDPRITPIGRFIRRTSIDELPQLFNVLRGDMSLVGPRPPLPNEVEGYTPYERQRLRVTPGCTGLWQVSGRSKLGFKRMLELDLEYIAEWSIWLDVKIMLRTFRVLFGSKDAY